MFQEIAMNLAANWIDRALQMVFRGGIPSFKWVYYKELRIALREMPFIYRHMALDTAEGFVDIEIEYLRREKAKGNDIAGWSALTTFERLRNARRAVFLGEAGIGKTTLFRYSVLSILNSSPAGRQLESNRNVVPIYVPLKAIDNREPSPILRYIRTRIPYFRGHIGMRRLISLGKKSRLFLFLDGYDEVPIVDGSAYIAGELTKLFSSDLLIST